MYEDMVLCTAPSGGNTVIWGSGCMNTGTTLTFPDDAPHPMKTIGNGWTTRTESSKEATRREGCPGHS